MEKLKRTLTDIYAVRRIVIGVFCAFIGSCVCAVLFHAYEPNMNSLGALSSVCMDVVCIIILFILIFSFAFGKIISNRTTGLFAVLLVADAWALFLDFLNWAFDGELALGSITFWFTVGSLCMGSILACLFSLYIYTYMDESHGMRQMRKSAFVCAILNLISFALTFALALTGTAFKFVDGHYETGVLYDVITVIPILTLLYLIAYLIANVKKVGIRDIFAVVGYVFFMIAGALIEAAYGIGTTYVAVAIANVYIFVMLQNEITEREKRNAQQWKEKSYTDELTGFFNRYAYEADVTALENDTISDDFVYVSVDVNALKPVNDTLGHNAGDEMLVGTAECLKECLGPFGKLYRIGGDEFAALINTDEENMKQIEQHLDSLTGKWQGKMVKNIALSYGTVTRKEMPDMNIRQMAILADRRMYESKNEYYRTTGIERRRCKTSDLPK